MRIPPPRAAFAAAVAVLALAACASAPLETTPSATLPPACPIEGCTRDARVDLDRPASAACPAAQDGDCGGLTPSACTDDALASWSSLEGGRTLGCVAQMLGAACAQGEARACSFAGRLWLGGAGLEKDVARGLKMLTLACDGGVPLACLVGSRYLGEAGASAGASGSEQDLSDLQHRLEMEHSCLTGQGEACMQVGALFRLGDEGFPRDFAQAVRAYTRGCNLGDSGSCNNLGDALAYGEGVDRDLDRAVDAFDKACHLGEALGCANLGYRLERGLGVGRDAGRARALYRDACNVGSSYGCLHLELLTAQGGRGPRDVAASLARWSRACEEGKDGRACAFLGLLYDDGPDGLARDVPRSLAAMSRGCSLGEPRACDWVRMHGED